jgi:hypothetical protein
MPKHSDEKIALVALIGFAGWLFVGLPLLYLPGERTTNDWETLPQWLAALIAAGVLIAAALFTKGRREIARKGVMIEAVTASGPDIADGSRGPLAGANRQIEITKAKLDEATVQISALALGVSLLATGFAIYQWWTTGRDEKIRATIEVSNKYIEEAINPEDLQMQYDVLRRQMAAGQANIFDVEKLDAPLRIKKHYSRLEYISYLANRGKLDLGYLSQFVICDVVEAPDNLTEAKKLREARKLTCPSSEQPDEDKEDDEKPEAPKQN